ncbi:hypothetical protein MMC30_007676 [Trapelia coarctata]|nr:hypothetical protein [Trapelia coarctata]
MASSDITQRPLEEREIELEVLNNDATAVPSITAPIHTDTRQERRDATEEEIKTLRHVVDNIPTPVWIALFVGAAERFTYFGITAPWQNYMQNSLDDAAVPGALGLGQSTATNIYNAFYLFSFLTPLPFAIVSDVWLGRYKTLWISVIMYIIGCVVMVATSVPNSLQHGAGVGGLATAMVLIGLGSGGVKAVISPFIGDQYTPLVPQLLVRKSGERVVADRTLTIQYIYNVFYWFTNIAGLSLVATTYLEKTRGFWAAFLLPTLFFWVAVLLLLIWMKAFVKLPPQGNVLPMAAKTLLYASRNHFSLDAAKPAYQYEKFGKSVPWDDHFIAEMKRGLIGCRVLFSFSIFYLCINQMSNNLVSQAGQMELHGIPNDTYQAINPIVCIVLGPIIQKLLYPFLQRRKIPFGPIARMTVSFITMAAAMACAAGVQHLIYNAGPCYDAPLRCPASDGGKIPNSINVWIQTPIYFLLSLAEIFGFVSLSEYSYTKAPKNLRAVVQALRQVTAGVGSALGMALSPLAADPKVLYLYVGLAAAMMTSAPFFWAIFKKYDKMEEELNMLDAAGGKPDETKKQEA